MSIRPTPQAEIIQRLRSAAGHLNAVIEMAESGKPCEEVLHQLQAVEAALRHAGRYLLCCQIEQSEALIVRDTEPAKRATELKRLVSLYSILVQDSKRHVEVHK